MNETLQRIGETMRTAWGGMTGLQRTGLFLLVAVLVFMIGWTVNTAAAPTRPTRCASLGIRSSTSSMGTVRMPPLVVRRITQ